MKLVYNSIEITCTVDEFEKLVTRGLIPGRESLMDKYKDDEITGKQAEEMLSDALDEAIANKHDYTIRPEDIGEELDFNNSPCSLEVLVGDYETYGGI